MKLHSPLEFEQIGPSCFTSSNDNKFNYMEYIYIYIYMNNHKYFYNKLYIYMYMIYMLTYKHMFIC